MNLLVIKVIKANKIICNIIPILRDVVEILILLTLIEIKKDKFKYFTLLHSIGMVIIFINIYANRGAIKMRLG